MLTSLYKLLPVAAQNLAISAEGYRLKRRRYSLSYLRLADSVRDRRNLHGSDLVSYWQARLRAHFAIASRTPFWNQRFAACGIQVGAEDAIAELSKLPLLSKREVQQRKHEIISREFNARDVVLTHTSGTTGGGLVFPETKEAERERWAVWWRYRAAHSIAHDDWCGYFGGRSVVPITSNKPPFWRENWPGRQVFFSGYHLSERTASLYLDELSKRQLPWLHGYPSMLALLGEYALRGPKRSYGVKIVTIGAETLLQRQKEVIQAAFGAPVIQHYGQAEAVANISQCPGGSLHVDEDFSFVEFIPTETCGLFRIVGTNFSNPAFPLFRFDTSDLVTLPSDKSVACACGREWRSVESIDGRIEDYVVLPDGRKIGRLDHVFKDREDICEAQLVQQSDGAIRVQIVRGPSYHLPHSERQLLQDIRSRIGPELPITVSYSPSIARTSNGKLRFVVRESN